MSTALKAPIKVQLQPISAKPSEVNDLEWKAFLSSAQDTSVEWRMVTPKEAQEELFLNDKNRKLSQTAITFYAEQIKLNLWMMTGETVIYGRTGALLNGQHRYHAIIQAGKAAPILIVRGISDDSFKAIDRGKGRTMSDILSIKGEINTNQLASAAGLVEAFFRTGRIGKVRAGRHYYHQIESTLNQHPGLRDSVHYIAGSQRLFTMGSPSMQSALHYLMTSVDPDCARWFWDRLLSGAELASGNPILLLRNLVLKNHSAVQKYSLDQIARYTIKAWNLYAKGETKTLLHVRENEDLRKLDIPIESVKRLATASDILHP